MSEKRYVVRLSGEERMTLIGLVKSEERIPPKRRMRAQVLLKVDEGDEGPGWTDERAAEAFDVHVQTVHAIRKQLVTEGFEVTLTRKRPERPPRPPVVDEAKEETLLAIAQGEAPAGRTRWTLRLLADELVRLEVVDAISHETVRKALKKTRSIRTGK